MSVSLTSLLLPAALVFGAPHNTGEYQRGIFCETVELVEFVVGLADRGGDPDLVVGEINRKLDRRACLYKTQAEVITETLRLERYIAANNTTYAIYQVSVSGLGHQMSEFGELDWTFSQPLTMYTLRGAPAGHPDKH